MRRLIDLPWPTERETIEEAIEFERGGTTDEKLRRLAAIFQFVRKFSRGPDPLAAREKQATEEALVRWIRQHRGR